jgi:Flp pilus assembly protein TadG
MATSKSFAQKEPMRNRNKRGIAITELAILMPLLVLLCLVAADLGRGCQCGIALANATRVGAEYGATRLYDSANAVDFGNRVTTAAREEFSAQCGLDPAELQITCEVTTSSDGLHQCRVSGTYPFRLLLQWPTMPSSLLLKRVSTFRRFR